MTGKGIWEALSFVEDRYIEEAETGTIRTKRPALNVLLPLAACFCIAFLLFRPGADEEAGPAVENMDNAAMQEIKQEALPEINVYDNSLEAEAVQEDICMDGVIVISPSEVPSIILRIKQWTEEGFTATVEEYVDSEAFPLGETVQVEFMINIYIESYDGEIVSVVRRVPTEADFPVGTLVMVRYSSISEEFSVIRAEVISIAQDD